MIIEPLPGFDYNGEYYNIEKIYNDYCKSLCVPEEYFKLTSLNKHI